MDALLRLSMSTPVLQDFEGPSRRWISALAEEAGIGKPEALAGKIAHMMQKEQCDQEIWTAIKDHIWLTVASLDASRLFYREVLRTARERRQHGAQWLPPALVVCQARTLVAPPQAPPPSTTEVFSGMQSQSSFFRLPAELRLKIYGHVLALPSQTRYKQNNTAPGLLVPHEAAQPAFTRTCRQARSEMLPSFHESSTFVFYIDRVSALHSAKRWIHTIGDHHVGLLRSIVLHGFERGDSWDLRDIYDFMRAVRVGVDLGNLTARITVGGGSLPRVFLHLLQVRQESRMRSYLNGMAGGDGDWGGRRGGVEDLVGLVEWFAKGISDSQTGRVRMVVE
ncbi:hypothetical protein LTR36_003336 [Oleoguttula mirabilis]|uniref:Uncharacterized protein n=1 Tax=Oleoguttula mirabilis TaxID=1507867 RepID=A0AAV9JYG9_9PEZI|nr:hypothetical protein LTR36_003336 [Oleoguttula mirabilis]